MTSTTYHIHESILKSSPPGALGVFTDSSGTTRVVLPRTFYPSQSSDMVHRAAPFSRLYLPTFKDPQKKVLDQRSIVVFCAGWVVNGKAGAAVFFGPGSAHNVAERLPAGTTAQGSQLHAVSRALQLVRAHIANTGVYNVVLATDSECVVKTLTEAVYNWRLRGWPDDSREVRDVDRLIEDMEKEALDVEFWGVGREENREATGMARDVCGR